MRLPLIGNFNVYNSLAAIAAVTAMGIDVRTAVLALATAPAVPGRLEAVPAQRSFRVFVDYAHTDDALINALKTLRELKPARLLVVFGCGGSRDRSKRPRMGAAVDEHADYAIVTSDNPRQEEPMAIIEDIKPGLRRGNFEVIEDRRAAIQRAIDLAQPRDIVLIAGKGHETYQEFADATVPFDDVAVAHAGAAKQTGGARSLMDPTPLQLVAHWAGGTLRAGDGRALAAPICTDSRASPSRRSFRCAARGEFRRPFALWRKRRGVGAVGAIVEEIPPDLPPQFAVIQVADTLAALAKPRDLSTAARCRCRSWASPAATAKRAPRT